MNDIPPFFMLILVAVVAALGVAALRGLRDMVEAIRNAELARLSTPCHWQAVRAFLGLCVALPVYFVASPLGGSALGAAALTAGLGYAIAPRVLEEIRRRAQEALLDELALHLDLIALAVEAGGSLTSALSACAERAPGGPLQRCWSRAVADIRAGAVIAEVLRELEQRIGVRAFTALVAALRSAERAGLDAAVVLRERARQAAAARFARAEQLARAAPLKLWATMVLCLAPCTMLVLAFPLAQLLAIVAGA